MQKAARADRLGIVYDPLRILLFVLTVLTVSRVHQHYPILRVLRPALLVVIVAAVYAYLNPRYLTRANVLALWPMRLVAVLGVLACCSAVFGLSLGATAAFILSSYVKTLVYSLLLAVSIRNVRDLATFVWAYVISCGILAFFALFVFGISAYPTGSFARLSNMYTFDANDMCVIMMVGLPLTLLLLVSTRGNWRARGLLLVILAGICASIARSGSRGGFLGLLAIAAAGVILANNVSVMRRAVITVAAALAFLLGATPGYWKQMGTLLEPKEDYNYSTLYGRKAIAERGLGYMMQYPAFGVGMDNFARAECSIGPMLDSLSKTGPIRCRPPHNSFVEAGSELGFPGLIVWVSLVLGVIVALLRLRGRLPRAWRRGTETERFLYGATSFFPLAMIGFAVTAFFVTFAWQDPLYILAALTSGLYIALRAHVQCTAQEDLSADLAPRHSPRGTPGWRVAQSAQRILPRRPAAQRGA